MLVPLPVTIDTEHSEKSPSHTKCSINISDDDKKRGWGEGERREIRR